MMSIENPEQLSEIYSKADLERSIFPLVKSFYLQQFFKMIDRPQIEAVLSKIRVKKTLNKTEMVLLSFSVFENRDIYHEFLQTLPKAINILIEKLLWVESITDVEAEKILGEPITVKAKYEYLDKELKKEFYFFNVHKLSLYLHPRPDARYILSIHPLLKQVLMEFYPKPLHYNFIPLDEIPKTRYHFNAEQLMFQEMPRIVCYYLQDGIKYSNSGKPADATLNKLQRSCSITEFYDNEDPALSKIRTILIAGMLYNLKLKDVNVETVSVLKNLFNTQYLQLNTSQFIINSLKGWTYLDDYEYNHKAELLFIEALKQLPQGKWISSANLIEYFQHRFINITPVGSYALNNRLYYEEPSDFGDYKIKKNPGAENAKVFVKYPFIRGSIFLLAAFGLIEIAYAGVNTDEFTNTYYSAYDGLMYFKLTELGSYVLGLTSHYEPKSAQQKNKLHFAGDSLTILAEGQPDLLDVMLSNYAEKTGSLRYRVTHTHFLKDCKKAKDLERKIELFKQTVGVNLPAYWLQKFDEWKKNISKIKSRPQVEVYKLQEEAKDLHRAIAQDNVLKEIILKAENFHILVATADVQKFKTRMRELGYIVE